MYQTSNLDQTNSMRRRPSAEVEESLQLWPNKPSLKATQIITVQGNLHSKSAVGGGGGVCVFGRGSLS